MNKKMTLKLFESINEIEEYFNMHELAYNHQENILLKTRFGLQVAEIEVTYDSIEGLHDKSLSFTGFYESSEIIADIIIALQKNNIF